MPSDEPTAIRAAAPVKRTVIRARIWRAATGTWEDQVVLYDSNVRREDGEQRR